MSVETISFLLCVDKEKSSRMNLQLKAKRSENWGKLKYATNTLKLWNVLQGCFKILDIVFYRRAKGMTQFWKILTACVWVFCFVLIWFLKAAVSHPSYCFLGIVSLSKLAHQNMTTINKITTWTSRSPKFYSSLLFCFYWSFAKLVSYDNIKYLADKKE